MLEFPAKGEAVAQIASTVMGVKEKAEREMQSLQAIVPSRR